MGIHYKMSDNNKIIGLVRAWAVEDWIRPAIRQALEYCDDVAVIVAPFHHKLKKFADATYDICKEYRDIRLIDFKTSEQYVGPAMAEALNRMLQTSPLHAVGNWIWILDSDEFYTERTYKEIKSTIASDQYNWIGARTKVFLINMQRYLETVDPWHYWRLIKIEDTGYRFKPYQNWSHKLERPYLLPKGNEMFHYSMLTNTDVRLAWWRIESAPGITNQRKIRWLNEIYIKYDIENEDYWVIENLKLNGIKSPWLSVGWAPDENGNLLKYEGRHPKFIESAELPKIEDFREYYKSRGDKP